jgi:hypothetical protein
MAAANPAHAWDQLLERLADAPGPEIPEKFTVLDHLLFGIVQENSPPSLALEAYKNLVNGFFNFNEMRVAHPAEFVAQLEGVVDAPAKAQRMLDVFKFVFETTYGFDLESMKKKPVRQAQKQLSKVTGATRFAVSATVQRALGGTAAAIDDAGRELLVACGVASPTDSLEIVLAQVESLLTEESAASLCLALEEAAHDPSQRGALKDAVSENGVEKKKSIKKVAKRATS